MANGMPDGRQEDGSYRRIEVITGQRRRRRWTVEEKARIVAESFEEGANISEVARRHGVARGLLTVWRHQVAAGARGQAACLVPIPIAPASGGATASAPDRIPSALARVLALASPAEPRCGAGEVEVSRG